MSERFPGFPPEALKFLRQLKKNNNRDWFQPRKEEYERLLRDPMLELCGRLNGEIAKFAPDYVIEPTKSIFRIYRDTRFSKDKTPYKTHIAAVFNNRLLPRNYGSGFYFHLDTEKIGMGGGIYHPEPALLKILRGHMAEHHEDFVKVLKGLRAKKITGKFEGHEMTRVPKGWDADHPAADLLKCRSMFFFAELPAEEALAPTIAKEIASRFRTIAPFVELLDKPLIGQKTGAKRFTVDDMV